MNKLLVMRKCYKFRLHPTKKQAKDLQAILDECRWLYNQLLEQRKLSYEELELSLSKYQQLMFLPLLKEERKSLEIVHSQVLQDVVSRLDKAFEAFFRRCKTGESPGYPRFRGIDRYDSFTYPQSGFTFTDSSLKLSKIGSIRVKQHRPIEGEIKTCTIRRDTSGKWYVSLSCLIDTKPLEMNDLAVGIDVGIESFAHLSDGTVIENPRFLKKEEKAIAKAQKKLAKYEKGSLERKKYKKVVAKTYERVRNKRADFCHKISRTLINRYGTLCIEELDIQNMVEGSPLSSKMSKSISDAAWNKFHALLSYKAVEAGRRLGVVKAAYTSQKCSACGHIQRKKLSERVHSCSQCGYTAHRDLNAAKNILALGLDGQGDTPPRSLRL